MEVNFDTMVESDIIHEGTINNSNSSIHIYYILYPRSRLDSKKHKEARQILKKYVISNI